MEGIEWEKVKEYGKVKVLGKGAYGTCFHGQDKKSRNDFAVKQV